MKGVLPEKTGGTPFLMRPERRRPWNTVTPRRAFLPAALLWRAVMASSRTSAMHL